jgi:hypothetical protein
VQWTGCGRVMDALAAHDARTWEGSKSSLGDGAVLVRRS